MVLVVLTGIIFDIKKFAMFDGPGIRTTVFLKGCPLNCWWCHNPESIREFPEEFPAEEEGEKNEIVGKRMSAAELLAEIQKDAIFYDESGGGVTFSGGEPLVQARFLDELLALCKAGGIQTAVDTSGYAPWPAIESVIPNTDLFLYDLKLMNNDLHQKYTGLSNEVICENLLKLLENGSQVTIRIPLIPGITDTDENLKLIAAFLMNQPKTKEVDLLPFNHYSKSKYNRFRKEHKLARLKTQTAEELARMALIFQDLGATVNIRS